MTFSRFRTAAVALAAVGILAAGCTDANPASDTQVLHYKGGSVQAQKFEKCYKPGTRGFDGPGDFHYSYPFGQRTYSFTDAPGAKAESGPIQVKTKDSQQMSVRGFVTFELTSDCEKLRQFHERIGLKYRAYFDEGQSGSEGWNDFLADYLSVPINATMDRAGLKYGWKELYVDPAAQDGFRSEVLKTLPAAVNALIGDDSIKIVGLSTETPQPSEKLLASLQEIEAARAENQAQIERNKVLKTKYGSFTECKKVMTEDSCVVLALAEQGKIPFYPVPAGGNINVTPPN